MQAGPDTAREQIQAMAAMSESPLELLEFEKTEDGDLVLQVSIDCSGIPLKPGGMPLRLRECFQIVVPNGFPFEVPTLLVAHSRFLGFPHVYWGHYLCLFQAPETEWNPSDGMFGFMERVDLFLRNAAAGQLDPIGAPMHPPTTPASKRKDLPTIIPKADTPRSDGEIWFGFAMIENVSRRRIDLTGWKSISDENWPEEPSAVAVLLNKPLSHQFPSKIGQLITELRKQGVNRNTLILLLRCALIQGAKDIPLLLIIGAPMRGTHGAEESKQHLTAWWIEAEAANALRLAMPKSSDSEELRDLRSDYEEAYFNVLEQQSIHWCPLLEDRPEIIVRRDIDTAASWFRGKTVAIWGCGAIGAQIAESVVRAGVARVVIYDNARVKPGVLIRQPFEDLDIGMFKAKTLKERLQRIRPDLIVEANVSDVRRAVLDREDWNDGADIVFDATASRAVLAKLEFTRKIHSQRVPIVSMVIGPTARKAMLLVTGAWHSGGPLDASRSAKLSLLGGGHGQEFLDNFFPQEALRPFQPEPGCSEPTFVGSYSDVASLSHLMVNAVPDILNSIEPSAAEARFYAPSTGIDETPREMRLRIDRRLSSNDPTSGFEVRIARTAWLQMQNHINDSSGRLGEHVETGGILLGERDESLRVMWVDEFSGPPSDSILTPTEFLCGVKGTRELHETRSQSSLGSIRYIGMWHTHPESLPVPSHTDFLAMSALADEAGALFAHSLMIIIGTPLGKLALATYAFSRMELSLTTIQRTCVVIFPTDDLIGLTTNNLMNSENQQRDVQPEIDG